MLHLAVQHDFNVFTACPICTKSYIPLFYLPNTSLPKHLVYIVTLDLFYQLKTSQLL